MSIWTLEVEVWGPCYLTLEGKQSEFFKLETQEELCLYSMAKALRASTLKALSSQDRVSIAPVLCTHVSENSHFYII